MTIQIGPGTDTDIWEDKWLPGIPPRKPQPNILQDVNRLKTPAQLMKDHAREWDEEKVKAAIHPENVQEVLNIRPLQYSRKDKPVWPYTTLGQYSVKTGYKILHKNYAITESSAIPQPLLLHNLCKLLWSFSLAPKVKIFWWKVLQNGLPTRINLRIRGADIDPVCPLCGEAEETIGHLITYCRVTKEIWSHLIPSAHTTRHLSTMDFINHLWRNEGRNNTPLSAIVGWNIWKARNKLIFNNEAAIIPHIIRRASEEHHLWSTTISVPGDNASQRPDIPIPLEPSQTVEDTNQLCYVDASWTNSYSNIGISWNLYDGGRLYLKGIGAFPPTASASDAEGIAILEACRQMVRFGKPGVTIYSDARNQVDSAIRCTHLLLNSPHPQPLVEDIAVDVNPIIEDLSRIAISVNPPLSFKYLPRAKNIEADKYAKLARTQNLPYTITWT